MSSPQHHLASLFAACALALAAAGCHAPWPVPDSDYQRPVAASPTPTPAAATKSPPPAATEADMAGVFDKLQQVGDLDPRAQKKLIDQLQHTDPKFWPAVAEQFRASLAYHQELVSKERLAQRNIDVPDAPPMPRPFPTQAKAEPRPNLVPPYQEPAPPSTQVGSLLDPRRADADGVSSEALAHASPSAQYPPADPLVVDLASDDANAPASFEAEGPAFPIATQRHPIPLREKATSPVIPAKFNAVTPAEPTRPSKDDIQTDDKKDWQQLVAEAADDLSHRVADSPATTAEIHQHVSLRILRLLAGQTEAALEPIPHIAPAEQDYWSRQIFALATYLDHHTQPDGKRRAAASVIHLDEAVANLRDLGALSLRNFAFCKNIYGYGAIEAYTDDRFTPGQQVSLYIEVENYHSQQTEKGFNTSLASTYEILDEKGERVDGGEFPKVDDTCRSRRRDFHIQFGLKLPEKIAPGRYQIELVVRDRQSDKIAHATAAFEIRGNVIAPPPKPFGAQ